VGETLSLSCETEGIAQLCDVLRHADFQPALNVLRRFSELHDPKLASCLQDSEHRISFRATAVRDGKHTYKSLEIARAMGDSIVERFGYRVDLDGFDVEVRLEHRLTLCAPPNSSAVGFITMCILLRCKMCLRLSAELTRRAVLINMCTL
jgi:hypothetical protein